MKLKIKHTLGVISLKEKEALLILLGVELEELISEIRARYIASAIDETDNEIRKSLNNSCGN